MENWLYTFAIHEDEIWSNGEKYKAVIITHWTDKTENVKEGSKKIFYFIGRESDIREYFRTEKEIEDFYHANKQYDKFSIKKEIIVEKK